MKVAVWLIIWFYPLLLCAQAPQPLIIQQQINWGFRKHEGKRKVDAIVIHSTYNASSNDSFSIDGILKQFATYKVSAHYLLDRNGTFYQLVDENNISFHAGKGSLPDGRTHINSCSIGIEVITTKKSSPTEEQYQALAALVRDIRQRYVINYIVGHNDIAPLRKTDPWNFDWVKFNNLLGMNVRGPLTDSLSK